MKEKCQFMQNDNSVH